MPTFGPKYKLDFDKVIYYKTLDEKEKLNSSWSCINPKVKKEFESLGVIDSEKYLDGIGVQYESEVIYHNMLEELVEKKVTNSVTPTYISDMITIQLKAPYNTRKIVPLNVMIMDKPVEIMNYYVITNYFARPLQSPLKFFTSTEKIAPNYEQPLYFTDEIIKMSTLDINQKTNPKPFTIDDLDKDVEELNKNVGKLSDSYIESECMKFISITDIKSPMAKTVSTLQYVKEIPDKLPPATTTAYVTHFNKKFRTFVKNYKLGYIIAPGTRKYVDLVIYIPSLSYVLSPEQLDIFTKLMIQDIITAHNFSMIA
jgi:hypothetical protein